MFVAFLRCFFSVGGGGGLAPVQRYVTFAQACVFTCAYVECEALVVRHSVQAA